MKFEVEYVVRRRDRPRHSYTLLSWEADHHAPTRLAQVQPPQPPNRPRIS